MLRKLERNKPHQLYFTRDGVGPLPGASGIAGLAEDAGGLIHWAFKKGLAGEDYKTERDAAADSGTIAHAMCESYLLGDEIDLTGCSAYEGEPELPDWSEESIELGKIAFEKFKTWWEKHEFVFLQSELQLVSHSYLYGGTLDILAKDKDGAICLIDLKTNKKLRASHSIQTGGYSLLVNENFPNDKVDKICLLRLPKDNGKIEPLWLDADNHAYYQQAFLANLAAHYARHELEKVLPKSLQKRRPRLKKAA